MNKYRITFFGREQGAIGQFATMNIEVQTPYSFINDDIAIMAINKIGYECNYLKDIEKL